MPFPGHLTFFILGFSHVEMFMAIPVDMVAQVGSVSSPAHGGPGRGRFADRPCDMSASLSNPRCAGPGREWSMGRSVAVPGLVLDKGTMGLGRWKLFKGSVTQGPKYADDEHDSETKSEQQASRDVFWQMLCDHPVLYHCKDFLTPEECDAIIRMSETKLIPIRGKMKSELNPAKLSPDDAKVLQDINLRITSLSGVALHDGENPLAVHFTPPSHMSAPAETPGTEERMSLGLHVDTNHRERRWLTFIVYLQSVLPKNGGHTIFPLALRRGLADSGIDDSGLRNASMTLLSRNSHHTRNLANDMQIAKGVREAARDLLHKAEKLAHDAAQDRTSDLEEPWWDPSGVGLAVPPVRGSCVAFFTRSAHTGGAIDPRSWHGGAAVVTESAAAKGTGTLTNSMHRTGKWTLQKFREVPNEDTHFQSASLKTLFDSFKERTRHAVQSFATQHSSLMERTRHAVQAFAAQHSFLHPSDASGVRSTVDDSTQDPLKNKCSYCPALVQNSHSISIILGLAASGVFLGSAISFTLLRFRHCEGFFSRIPGTSGGIRGAGDQGLMLSC
eukprot:gnl/MRDRNA2_/MRDRNA2_76575_c0_seq1.p1 gnl/MRDRNA2_/MRDRNA2_76575_c0~~gnl/MRDRNA2_/MRDRNA2_76575_c0_seq1.p1  ORF type:complete len:558 (+),score=59.85 gnl/MRDRNA2_/MRDRNA2_76575_c0_seq1:158-1831(+)